MTQAINLANFSNSLDSSGQLSPTSLNAPVPLSKGGTNATTAATARTNLDVAQAVFSVPSGGIIMWSGSVASIPTGWFLCNGANGTPDLRDRFVVGAGSTYAVAATGGSANAITVAHTHTATSTDAGHTHNGSGNYSFWTTEPGLSLNSGGAYAISSHATTATGTASITTTNASTGASGTNANLPPYLALAYIMKS
jgi:hypothetical protein